MIFRHIVIDMQRLVFEDTAWHSPAVAGVLPNVVRLSSEFRSETLYARFCTPRDIGAADGCWKSFYRRWPMVTTEVLAPELFELVDPLAQLATVEQQFDKPGFSIFSALDLDPRLRSSGVDTLILSGTETDVCVYSSALGAVDLGYSVIMSPTRFPVPTMTRTGLSCPFWRHAFLNRSD